jgi:hypothetical protein
MTDVMGKEQVGDQGKMITGVWVRRHKFVGKWEGHGDFGDIKNQDDTLMWAQSQYRPKALRFSWTCIPREIFITYQELY